jgi:hypothetical protein
MNRLPFKFLQILVAAVLLPLSGFGQMAPATADRLQQSINDLHLKILALSAPNFPRNLHRGPYDARATTVNALFLQNLRQLRTNLIGLWQAANTLAGQLDVATIGAHLHNGLQQSAFTDTAGTHAAGLAVAPVSPFRVSTGKSSYRAFGNIIPLHNSVNLIALPLQHPPINDVATIQALKAATIPFQRHLAVIHPIPTQMEVDSAIEEYANCFSNGIILRQLSGGEVIVRCCQQGAPEPGCWWVPLQDFPLSAQQLREDIANLPDWNQNGNFEFFVVPERCNITILEGRVAAQQLKNSYNSRYFRLNGRECYGMLFRDNVQAGQRNEVTKAYLQGGAIQMFVLLNSSISGHNIGNAFVNNMPCFAIIETGFDVELP